MLNDLDGMYMVDYNIVQITHDRNTIEMVWTPPQNGRQSLAKEDLPMDTARQGEKRKTAIIMEEPSDGFHEKQKHGRRYGRGQTSFAFGSGWTALGCIDPIYM